MINPSKSSVVEGLFYGMRVRIFNKKTIQVVIPNLSLIAEIKPQINKIAQYAIDEGFVTELVPRIEIVTK
jgi:hypothetical protein